MAASPESNVQTTTDLEKSLFSVRNLGGQSSDLHVKLSELSSKCPEGVQSLISEIRTELTMLRSDLELANEEVESLEIMKDEAD